jgi:CheY-like chemotaxis protein
MTKTILYIDDDADDQALLSDAMRVVAPEVRLKCVNNGLEALSELQVQRESKTLPCLIVLDLNMPFLSGEETYKILSSDPELKRIPLAILSSSQKPADQLSFENRGVPFYSKPLQFSELTNVAEKLAHVCD